MTHMGSWSAQRDQEYMPRFGGTSSRPSRTAIHDPIVDHHPGQSAFGNYVVIQRGRIFSTESVTERSPIGQRMEDL